jgi:hypothetical protein
MAFSYDGTNWYFNGFVYDGGGGTGYVYYRYVGKYFGKGYYYMFHGYGSY